MPKVNVGKALTFIEKSGDPVLIDLSRFVVGRLELKDVLASIGRRQRKDGGWYGIDMDFQENISTVSATWLALRWFCWLDVTEGQIVGRTVAFLNRMQKEDGAWDEPVAIAQFEPSPRIMPGRYENRLWLTSAVCCFLSVLGLENRVHFDEALTFIRNGWDGNRFPEYIQTHWMVMPLLSMLHTGVNLQIISGCKRQLIQSIGHDLVDPGDFCAIAYASWLSGDTANELLDISLQKVLNNQLDDGGWATNYGDKHRAGFTVEALFLLRKLGILASQYVQ